MKRAILISIKPKYVADILNGKKTIEIRKTMPKCELPVTVYIYCTKQQDIVRIVKIPRDHYVCERAFDVHKDFLNMHSGWSAKGKVVAKFTLNKIDSYVNGLNWEYLQKGAGSYDDFESILKPSCLTEDDLWNYVDDLSFFAWHIENLQIFDKPMELTDLYKCKLGNNNCLLTKCDGKKCPCCKPVTNAPQSWFFVEDNL